MAVSLASRSSKLVCLVIILGTFSLASALNECTFRIPLGYTTFESLGVAYKVHTERRTWDDARQACLDENANLATIDTMQKIGYITAPMKRGLMPYAWTGISRSSSLAPWVSSDSHTVMPNLPWVRGRPISWHNCVAVRKLLPGLIDKTCSTKLNFVCEMPLRRYDGVVITN